MRLDKCMHDTWQMHAHACMRMKESVAYPCTCTHTHTHTHTHTLVIWWSDLLRLKAVMWSLIASLSYSILTFISEVAVLPVRCFQKVLTLNIFTLFRIDLLKPVFFLYLLCVSIKSSWWSNCCFQKVHVLNIHIVSYWLTETSILLHLLWVSIKSSQWSDSDSFLARHWSIR